MKMTTGTMQAGVRTAPARVRHSSIRKKTTLTAQMAIEMMKRTNEPERERPMRLLRKLLSDVPGRSGQVISGCFFGAGSDAPP